MNIDCTLFAQMLNFFIAYLIMRWLLFKPVIVVIKAEADEKKRIDSVVKSLDVSIQSIHHEQDQLWQAFHTSVATDVSSIRDEDNAALDTREVVVDIERLSQEQQENLIEVCAEHVVKKVEYVRK